MILHSGEKFTDDKGETWEVGTVFRSYVTALHIDRKGKPSGLTAKVKRNTIERWARA